MTVRKNTATGALSFPCQDCGKPAYAKKDGSDYYRNILAKVRLLKPAGSTAPEPAPAPAPTPEPKKPASLFGF